MISDETKAVRIFYRKSDNAVVWTHELRGPVDYDRAEFPNTVDDDLAALPEKVISIEWASDSWTVINEIKLGGRKEDYICVEEKDKTKSQELLAALSGG